MVSLLFSTFRGTIEGGFDLVFTLMSVGIIFYKIKVANERGEKPFSYSLFLFCLPLFIFVPTLYVFDTNYHLIQQVTDFKSLLFINCAMLTSVIYTAIFLTQFILVHIYMAGYHFYNLFKKSRISNYSYKEV